MLQTLQYCLAQRSETQSKKYFKLRNPEQGQSGANDVGENEGELILMEN
jgi:hypothetical protein